MKKNLFLGFLVSFLTISMFASAAKPITYDQIPAQAKQIISQYFQASDVAVVERDYDREDRSLYEVTFFNGNKIEFDRSGAWTEINCKHTSVPMGLVPDAIQEVMKLKYPGKEIAKIEVDRRGFEVKVKQGPELKFDLNYVLIYIDD